MFDNSIGKPFRFLITCAWHEFRQRYYGTSFGLLWSVLQPAIHFTLLNLIFSRFLGRDVQHYASQLLLGIIIWQFFSDATRRGMETLVIRAERLKLIRVSRWMSVVGAVLSAVCGLMIQLPIVFIFLIATETPINWLGVPGMIAWLAYVLALSMCLSLTTAVITPRFRDLSQVWGLLLFIGFYVSPIIYPAEMLAGRLEWLLWVNPVGYAIHVARCDVLGTADAFAHVRTAAWLWLAISVIVGSLTFRKLNRDVLDFV